MLPDLDRKRISRRRFLKAMGIGSLAAVGTIAYGEQTSMDIETVHRELALPNWNADGIRFAFVTDLHADHPEAVARSIQAIRIAQRAKPEAVLFGGDYLTSAAPQHLQNLREVMATLGESSIPCYGVMGNHDYWISYFDLVKEAAISVGCDCFATRPWRSVGSASSGWTMPWSKSTVPIWLPRAATRWPCSMNPISFRRCLPAFAFNSRATVMVGRFACRVDLGAHPARSLEVHRRLLWKRL